LFQEYKTKKKETKDKKKKRKKETMKKETRKVVIFRLTHNPILNVQIKSCIVIYDAASVISVRNNKIKESFEFGKNIK